ncbi:DUF4474 domain-containing protein [Clostridium pasteurianum]|uniref:DUF4474 domain-containing protein n=1 Tax=Clostridium pasteurianum TaxID=1501 RepID=UPI002260C7C7|nr:DUF4474 domain-containing protein [Clostridium pasteurianum]UZW12682.1 DUF4474 domain-containing protein [Clostridium pasteurianum]
MDLMVSQVQQWLNTTYGNNENYTTIPEDGVTGGGTVAALITALQIELNISPADGVFGPATQAVCPTLSSGSTAQNQVYILQGALYCKGYNPNGLDGGYGNGVITAVKKFQADAGLTTQDGITTPMIFKALLNTDAFVLLSSGDSNIRTIQQHLNRDYNNVFGLIPCDGIYSKSTNVALIKALQHEEGIATDGIWGPTTQNLCPTIPGQYANTKFILLLQYALYCNGYNPNGFDGLYGNGVKNAVTSFQVFAGLYADGYAGKQTWASLLVSYGDPNRQGTACDCSTTITDEKAATLKANGYNIVGRYLTGRYAMTFEEISVISQNNLKVVPIFEVGGYQLSYFTSLQGMVDANSAMVAATTLGFPDNTIIYFAVDFDALDEDVTNNILLYFQAINNRFTELGSSYRIGIYAPRNVCSRVAAAGYSCSSFVCDMSSGFSGNLGYPLPYDWAFDQISTISCGSGYGYIEIDNNICSGKDTGVSVPIKVGQWVPNSTFAKVVSFAGFLYDPNQDIIYSKMNPLQRNFGYCKFYDDSAATPLVSTIIDCEPIYFTYDSKDWLIEFWKGQYCLETGAEIGIYNRDVGITDPRDAALGKFFKCVEDKNKDELLNMSFVLKKDGVEIFRRGPENHWWLTGFKWGEFTANPSNDLTMDITITLKDEYMRSAFLQGLEDLGYVESDMNINNNTVSFTFGVPKSQQPQSKIDNFNTIQSQNQSRIADYNLIKNELNLTSNDPNLIQESAIQELSTEAQEAYNRIIDWFNSIIPNLENIINS